jgi:uncharacterized linocin/CFP29 family protein
MDEYLMREEAPLSQEEWGRLDHTVVEVAKRVLVGRRFIHLFGPLGSGTQYVTVDRLEGKGDGPFAVDPDKRRVLPLTVIEKNFNLLWRDLATAKQTGLPFELGPAAVAAAMAAYAEDELIFKGGGGNEGLLNARGRLTAPLGNWDDPLAAIDAAAKAVGTLLAQGLLGPFVLVTSPVTYAKLLKPVNGMQIGLKLIEEVTEGGVFQTPALTDKEALVVSAGPENLDLAIGQDLVAAYLGPDGMDHQFRLLESVALRIKRPSAVCVLQG